MQVDDDVLRGGAVADYFTADSSAEDEIRYVVSKKLKPKSSSTCTAAGPDAPAREEDTDRQLLARLF